MSALTPKQKRFCEEYVIDFNGTQAAIRAGYSKKSANQTSSDLLAETYISEYVKILQTKLQERSAISAEMVINELAKCGFSNIQDYVEGGNEITDISTIDRSKAAAIAGIKTTTRTTTFEDTSETTVQTEIKLTDKISALEKLGKHLGIFEKDNTQKRIDVKQITIEPISHPKGK